jgi:hypothetical protein
VAVTNRGIAEYAMLLAVMLAVGTAMCAPGCSTVRKVLGDDARHEITADDFPQEIADACFKAKAAAVRWYVKKYGVEPIVPHVKVTWAQKPMRCGSVLAGAWTHSANRVEIWVGQANLAGSLEHEFRHCLAFANGLGGSEEAVR